MPITAGEIRAQMTLDASGFSQGVSQAQTSLNTLTAAGEQVQNAVGGAEARITSSASAIAAAMNEAGQGGNQLAQLAAKADQAGARADVLAQRAAAMAQKLAEAQQAAAESGEALAAMQESAAASAENLALAQQALAELQQSGTASAEALREAQASVDELTEEGAMLENQVQQLTAAHEANNAAVAEAEPRYRQLIAQLNGAEAAAEAAGMRFETMTDSIASVDAGGLAGLTGTLTQLGTSTLIRASRSLGTLATGAMGLSSSSVVGVLASRTLSTTLSTLVRTLGLAKFGLYGAGAAAMFMAFRLIDASTAVEDATDRWEELYDSIDTSRSVDFTAVANADIELDTVGLADQVQSVYTQIADALTDGKPDTPAVISEIQGSAQKMFGDVRTRIQAWYDAEMAKLDLSTGEGFQKAAALTDEYNALMGKVDALDTNTAAWIASYAGKSTAECTAALTQLETYEDELERLAKRADELAALSNSNQRAAFTAATNGLTTDQTTVANATQYVTFRYTMEMDNANDDYDAEAERLWHEYQDALQSAASDEEKLELEAEYSVKLEENEANRQAALDSAREEYERGLADIVRGVAEAAERSDPELAAAIQKALSGDFKYLGELDLDNSALATTIKNMIEAGVLEGMTDADLSTAEGQMQALIDVLSIGLEDAQQAWNGFVLTNGGGLLGLLIGDENATVELESDETPHRLADWARRMTEAAEAGDPEEVRKVIDEFQRALQPGTSKDTTFMDNAAKAVKSLLDVDADPSLIKTYTDALGNMLTVVKQMDAEDPEDFAFLDAMAQSLSSLGIDTKADTVAEALEWVYEAATGGDKLSTEPMEIGVPMRIAPEETGVPVLDEALSWIDKALHGELGGEGAEVTVPADVTVEPKTVTLPSGETAELMPDPEEQSIHLTVPADVTVEPESTELPTPEALGFDEWGSEAGDALSDYFNAALAAHSGQAEVTVPADVTVEPKTVTLPSGETAELMPDPEEQSIHLTVPADVTVEPESTELPTPEALGFDEWGSEAGDALSDYFNAALAAHSGQAAGSAQAIAGSASGALEGAAGDFGGAGDNAGSAFVASLRGYIQDAADAGTAIGSAAYNALKASLEIRSPSRKLRWLGRMGGRGFALGIDDEVLLAKTSMQRLAGGALSGAAAAATHNDQRTYSNTINNPVVRKDEDVRRLSRRLARMTVETTYGLT